MKIIICGAGQVGFGIARHLAGEGNDVTVIDQEPALMERIRDTLDVRPILGHGAHPRILQQAGAQTADILIAVTASDEVNMVTCQVAHSLFNIEKTIARVRDHEYVSMRRDELFSADAIPVDVIISPEREVAQMVMRRLALPGAFDVATFANGHIQMIGISIEDNCPVVDTPLKQLSELFPDLNAFVVGIERDGKLLAPEAKDSILHGDYAYVITAAQDTERTLKIFGHEEKQARHMTIIGGGNIGLQVAQALEKQGHYRLTMIESRLERAQYVAELLKNTVVLRGNGFSQEILAEAGIRDSDLILTLTNDDQVNILTMMLALREGCARGMCLINDNNFQKLAGDFGMNVAINPRAITISSVLSHIRRGRVRQVHTITDGAGEVIELEAVDESQVSGKKINELDLSYGIKFGAIMRGDDIILPGGNTEITPGDRIVAFAMADAIDDLEKLFFAPTKRGR